MCLSPINIINRTKFLSKEYRQPYFMSVRCGKCVECQRQNSMEWHYRSYYHFKNCVQNGGYVLFDTLTYSSDNLRHLSDFMQVPDDLDFPCFSYEDFRYFMVRLRKNLNKLGYGSNNLTYFAATEYGEKKHRPHIHVLFFVENSEIPYDVLSYQIARSWGFGRTDGIPFKTHAYVSRHNVIEGDTNRSLRVTRYVSKYVMKSCSFQSELNKRINLVCENEAINHDSGWLDTYEGRKYRTDLSRRVNQFHRQSKGFGLSALDHISFGQNVLIMPDLNKIVTRLPLPTYYKRKLYQVQIKIDGQRFWSYTADGVKYLQLHEQESIDLMSNKLQEMSSTYNVPCSHDFTDLAKYMLFERGFFNRGETASLSQKLDAPMMFNYVTHCDEEQFGKKFLCEDYCGLKEAYLDTDSKKLDLDYMRQRCYFYEPYEQIIKDIYEAISPNLPIKTRIERQRQRLRDLAKNLVV